MNKMKNVIIQGRAVTLIERSKGQLKGITIGDSLSYRFFDGEYQRIPLLFAEPKGKVSSPRSLALTAGILYERFNLPIVYLLPACPAYERQRLIDKDVYFVVSDKYAHLPMLVANERIRKAKQAKKLSLVAQFLLLYHLQIESLEGLAAQDMKEMIPYSYSSITLGITCLTDLGLCKKVSDGSKRKVLHFEETPYILWDNAQPYLINPIVQRVYCDEFHSDAHYPICGINALAHYTWLNPDPEKSIMMNIKQFQQLKDSGAIIRPNEFDGDIIIETWKYPPVSKQGYNAEWVDRLSLAITLRDETDPRVEGEVERLIKESFD